MARRVLSAWIALATCAGCAGTARPQGEGIDAAFRAIQRDEARIAAAGRQLEQIDGSIAHDAGACVERCAPLDEVIQEARAGALGVCEAAAPLDDADARTRCERAQNRGAAIDFRASELRARCGCGPKGQL